MVEKYLTDCKERERYLRPIVVDNIKNYVKHQINLFIEV